VLNHQFLIKLFFVILITFSIPVNLFAQNVTTLLQEAQSLEYKLQESAALEKYKAVLVEDATNLTALIKTTELSVAIGGRQKEKKDKLLYYQSAQSFAERAIKVDANNADVNYVMALVYSKLTEVEKENKQIALHIKATKQWAENALQINKQHAKANFIMGKWHVEMENLSSIKITAVKLLYGNLPKYSIDSAIYFLENCRKYDQYFMLNYFVLAKVYIQNNKPTKAIEILQKLIKLPLRTADDAMIKEEGKKLLNSLE
jgi:tetratricopeptide (TPR) repeat protein